MMMTFQRHHFIKLQNSDWLVVFVSWMYMFFCLLKIKQSSKSTLSCKLEDCGVLTLLFQKQQMSSNKFPMIPCSLWNICIFGAFPTSVIVFLQDLNYKGVLQVTVFKFKRQALKEFPSLVIDMRESKLIRYISNFISTEKQFSFFPYALQCLHKKLLLIVCMCVLYQYL